MAGRSTRQTPEKIWIFREFFTGLTNAYGTYDPTSGSARQVKGPVTDKVLLEHLKGQKPYGVYLLVKDRTRAIAVDFDTRSQLAPMEFVARAKHYGISAYIERSKSKGYHAWIFLEEEGVLSRKARLVVHHILDEIEAPDTEVFPKQDVLHNNTPYGNFICAPLFGALVPQGRTVFIDPANFEPYPDQWDLLESVKRLPESTLDSIIEMNDLSAALPYQAPTPGKQNGGHKPHTLPPCAQRMLRDGVSQNQRVACFRLAVHLKRLGLPYDIAVSALKTWALKNRPVNGKRVILEAEILSQSSSAYERSYVGYGCQSPVIRSFCDPSCPVNQLKKGKENIL
jgi:hypothetical protein